MTLAAAAVQGAAGFGFGLIAMPAFMWILGSTDAVQLVIIVNLAICAVLGARLRREANRGLLVRFCGGALLGLPVGLWAFRSASVDGLMRGVGVVLLAFVAFVSLRRPVDEPVSSDPAGAPVSGVGVGVLSGGMTVALGMPGPPIVLYLAAIGAAKDTLRATAFAFFTASYSASLALQGITTGLRGDLWLAAMVLLPGACAGGLLGSRLSRHVSERAFRSAVLTLLVAIGVSALFGGVRP